MAQSTIKLNEALKTKTLSVSWASGFTNQPIFAYQIGRIVFISGFVSSSQTMATYQWSNMIQGIPKPLSDITASIRGGDKKIIVGVYKNNTNLLVNVRESSPQIVEGYYSIVYITE